MKNIDVSKFQNDLNEVKATLGKVAYNLGALFANKFPDDREMQAICRELQRHGSRMIVEAYKRTTEDLNYEPGREWKEYIVW